MYMLSWHVEICDLIELLESWLQQIQFPQDAVMCSSILCEIDAYHYIQLAWLDAIYEPPEKQEAIIRDVAGGSQNDDKNVTRSNSRPWTKIFHFRLLADAMAVGTKN